MSRPKYFPLQLKLGVNECHFGLPQLWAVIHLTLSILIVKERVPGALVKLIGCALIKLIGLLLTTMARRNGIHSCLVQAEKGKFWVSTLSHKMCPTKQTTVHQHLWSWYHFSQEKLPQTLMPVIASTYCRKYGIPFFSGPPCISKSIRNSKMVKIHSNPPLLYYGFKR